MLCLAILIAAVIIASAISQPVYVVQAGVVEEVEAEFDEDEYKVRLAANNGWCLSCSENGRDVGCECAICEDNR